MEPPERGADEQEPLDGPLAALAAGGQRDGWQHPPPGLTGAAAADGGSDAEPPSPRAPPSNGDSGSEPPSPKLQPSDSKQSSGMPPSSAVSGEGGSGGPEEPEKTHYDARWGLSLCGQDSTDSSQLGAVCV